MYADTKTNIKRLGLVVCMIPFAGGSFYSELVNMAEQKNICQQKQSDSACIKDLSSQAYLLEPLFLHSRKVTPPKLNSSPPENLHSQKEGIVFQPSSSRGELLNFRGVNKPS